MDGIKSYRSREDITVSGQPTLSFCRKGSFRRLLAQWLAHGTLLILALTVTKSGLGLREPFCLSAVPHRWLCSWHWNQTTRMKPGSCPSGSLVLEPLLEKLSSKGQHPPGASEGPPRGWVPPSCSQHAGGPLNTPA